MFVFLYEQKNPALIQIKQEIKTKVLNVNYEEIPDIIKEKIGSNVNNVQNNKTAYRDEVLLNKLYSGKYMERRP